MELDKCAPFKDSCTGFRVQALRFWGLGFYGFGVLGLRFRILALQQIS